MVGTLPSCHHHSGPGLVQDEALDRVEVARPGSQLEHPVRVGIAGLPAAADAGGAEVDVLGVVLAIEGRGEQTGPRACG